MNATAPPAVGSHGMADVRNQRFGLVALLVAMASCGFVSAADATLPGRNGLLAFSRQSRTCDTERNVFTVRPDGTRLRRLTSYECQTDTSALGPAWSPSGARLLYTKSVAAHPFGNPAPPPKAVVMRPDGSAAHVVAEGFATAWGPGGELAWSAGAPNTSIYVGPFENPHERYIAPGFEAAWAPDGTELAVVDSAQGAEACVSLTIYDAVTGARKRVLVEAREENGRCVNGAISPDWSPDGSRLAFSGTGSREVTKDNYDIYVIRRDGTRLRRLTRGNGAHSSPVWSPDGRLIAYVAPNRPPPARYQSDLYVMRRDGSHKRLVVPRAASPSWRPRPR